MKIIFLNSSYTLQGSRIRRESRPDRETGKAQDLLLIQKFVRRMKGSKRKIVNGQIFEKAANLGPYQG